MTPATTHPEHSVEQAYIERVHRAYEDARQRALTSPSSAADKFSAREMRQRALERLSDNVDPEALCFGRIDLDEGKTYYLGRGAVHEPPSTLLVIDWRLPVAEGFYKATASEPHGLARRRRFQLDQARLLGIVEDRFAADAPPPSSAGADPRDVAPISVADVEPPESAGSGVPDVEPLVDPHVADAILADLDRSREPEMRDIVATIEARQYELMSAGLEGVLAIQGGPGSGKTAIALHRAAWLLYNHHEELKRPGVLVVGPNRAFMEYIRNVLPALGESAVMQLPVDRVTQLEDVRVRGAESELVARLKADTRMVEVVNRATVARVRRPVEDFPLADNNPRMVLPADAVNALIDRVWAQPDATYLSARDAFRRELVGLVERQVAELPQRRLIRRSTSDPVAVVVADGGPLDRIWPTVTAPEVLRDMLNSRQRLESAGAGLLLDDELELLFRPRARLLKEEPWTAADIALLDEIEHALRGPTSSYGYVIVDEAQDLTPMQLRMVLRRSSRGRATLVGDVAQATGPVRYATWEGLAEGAGASAPAVHELLIGYRVPRQIMELAGVLHERIAPGVALPRAIRDGTEDPRVIAVEAGKLLGELVAEVASRIDGDRTVGVIVPSERADNTRAALIDAGLNAGEILRDGLERRITVLTAAQSKGLEFDHVVVAEPVEIAGPDADWTYVYIALTRATQTLTVLHSTPHPFEMPPATSEPLREDPSDLPALAIEPEGTLLSARYTEALIRAKFLHGGQRRRGTRIPYLAHLQSVAALVLEDGGTEDEAIAALLHDAAEDFGTEQLELIADQFGDHVARIVEAVTDPVLDPGNSWRAMKAEHLRSLESAGPQARRVALAEKLDNARAQLRDLGSLGDLAWERMDIDPEDLLWYVTELADLFTAERPGDMAEEFGTTIELLLELASQPA